jgi:arabinogalactan endo-1,4-beta-galactosidase
MLTFSLFPTKKVQAATSFAKGADVGWLSEMEYYNWNFYNDNGIKQDCLQILKDHGINSIRLGYGLILHVVFATKMM